MEEPYYRKETRDSPSDSSDNNAARVAMVMLLGISGLLLLLVGVVTPYWYKERNTLTNVFVDRGIWYEEVCQIRSGTMTCERSSHLAKYRQRWNNNTLTYAYELEYSQMVAKQVVTFLVLAAGLGGFVCCIIFLFFTKWRYTILVTPFFIAAECLMWPTIGHDAALVHYRRDELTKDSNVLVQLPESLIIVAIAMILLFLLGFYFFVKGIKFVSKIPPQFYNQPGCFSDTGYSNRRYDSRRYSR